MKLCQSSPVYLEYRYTGILGPLRKYEWLNNVYNLDVTTQRKPNIMTHNICQQNTAANY